ncbi:CST complex subunit Ten1 [Aspergillus venezuelensis]
MNGPLPSTRAFLSDIPSLPADSKVRFLGCVKRYDIRTGHLVLEHNYPRTRKPKTAQGPKHNYGPPSISVDINAALDTVTWEELCVGAWVNAIGYVRKNYSSTPGQDTFYIEAVLVFPAGTINLNEYERILSDSLEVEKMMRSTW